VQGSLEAFDHLCLLHGDVHEGNIIVTTSRGRVYPAALVDFDRAFIGDPAYDLMTAYIRVLACHKHLLKRLLAGYGLLRVDGEWINRMMALVLLHPFDMMGAILQRRPRLSTTTSWNEMATQLWNIGSDEN
jgi:Ser/Thr protein kinase RdoA (MazF antagonist)